LKKVNETHLIKVDVFCTLAASRLISQDQKDSMIALTSEVISLRANVPFADKIFFGSIMEHTDCESEFLIPRLYF
jgi:hypothetical protein